MPTYYDGVHRSTYTVSGTLAEVSALIQQREEAGKASWDSSFTYNQEDGTITSATITSRLTIEMPEWSDYNSASQRDREEWDRFWAALDTHEQGHITLAQSYLDHADQALVGHPESEAQWRFDEYMAKIQAESDGYDADTGHGVYYGSFITVEEESEGSESDSYDSDNVN